jgi:Domain of unknown function (DUF3512)
VSEKERVVSLGELIGKLTHGSGTLIGLKDDRRNKAVPGFSARLDICNIR